MLLETPQKYENEIMKGIKNKIQKHIVPIFLTNNKNEPVFEGSGILLDYHGRKFLLSASHVFQSCEKKQCSVCIPIEKYTEPLKLTLKITFNEDNINDKHDLAVAEIAEDSVERIEKDHLRAFLPHYQTDKEYIYNEKMTYCFEGYPASMVKKRYRWNKLRTEALFYSGSPVEPKDNEQLYHYVRFDKKRVLFISNDDTEVEKEAPCLNGISGSGLWYVRNLYSHNPEYRLIGIIVMESADQKLIIATRIKYIFDIIDKYNT